MSILYSTNEAAWMQSLFIYLRFIYLIHVDEFFLGARTWKIHVDSNIMAKKRKQFDEFLGGSESLPQEVSIMQFVSSRAREISAMTSSIGT